MCVCVLGLFVDFIADVPVYQMRADEAIVYYGCSPPTSRYFGFQSYAFISDYKLLFASLGDSTNIEVHYATTPLVLLFSPTHRQPLV